MSILLIILVSLAVGILIGARGYYLYMNHQWHHNPTFFAKAIVYKRLRVNGISSKEAYQEMLRLVQNNQLEGKR